MKGDFTRFTFTASKHYDAVLMQQGRVQTDADWNEQVMITAHRNRAEASDIIGPTGVPQDLLLGGKSFLVSWSPDASGTNQLFINNGRYYADGVLVESEAPVQFNKQPGATLPPGGKAGIYLLYLDVWRRHVTSLEDVGIREIALAGADSGTRSQLVFQVRAEFVDKVDGKIDTPKAADFEPPWHPHDSESTGTLDASAGATPLENQLYRVEIHRGGTASTASCKWSRDNGTVVAKVLSHTAPVPDKTNKLWQFSIVIDRNGRDSFSSFLPGQMVELHSDEFVLMRKPGVFGTIKQVVADTLTLEVPKGSADLSSSDPIENPLAGTTPSARRWDNTWNPDDKAQATLLDVGTEFTDKKVAGSPRLILERDISVNFAQTAGDLYRTGDYWLIPARTLSGLVDWEPTKRQRAAGEEHIYAPLALVRIQADGSVTKPATDIRDMRMVFPTLRSLGGGFGGIVTGTGTENYLPKWQKTGASILINSSITDDGTTCAISDQLDVAGATTLQSTLQVSTAATSVAIARFTSESIAAMPAADLTSTVPTTGGVKTYVEGVVNGTPGRISKFIAPHAVSDSLLSESGSTVTALGTLKVSTDPRSATISRFTSESIAAMDPATLASTVPTSQGVKDFMKYSLPPGTVMAWGGETPPAGWLECNGWQYDGSPGQPYEALFNAIGKGFGTGSGAPSSFNLPDLRGRFVRGWNHGSFGRDPDTNVRSSLSGGRSGDRVGSYQSDAYLSHGHSVSVSGTSSNESSWHNHNYTTWDNVNSWTNLVLTAGGSDIAIQFITWRTDPTSAQLSLHTHVTSSTGSAASSGGSETRPKNVYLMYIIKY